jgi:hypothetical protein
MAIRTFIENLPSVGPSSDPFLYGPLHVESDNVCAVRQ